MARVLILHHVEPYWDTALKSYGLTFDRLASRIVDHLRIAGYDRVILTQFEDIKPTEEHFCTGLTGWVDDWYKYGYGWEAPQDDDEAVECLGNNKYRILDQLWTDNTRGHSDIVLIPEWLSELANDTVFIAGVFDRECLADLQDALEAEEIFYTRVEELIVG